MNCNWPNTTRLLIASPLFVSLNRAVWQLAYVVKIMPKSRIKKSTILATLTNLLFSEHDLLDILDNNNIELWRNGNETGIFLFCFFWLSKFESFKTINYYLLVKLSYIFLLKHVFNFLKWFKIFYFCRKKRYKIWRFGRRYFTICNFR